MTSNLHPNAMTAEHCIAVELLQHPNPIACLGKRDTGRSCILTHFLALEGFTKVRPVPLVVRWPLGDDVRQHDWLVGQLIASLELLYAQVATPSTKHDCRIRSGSKSPCQYNDGVLLCLRGTDCRCQSGQCKQTCDAHHHHHHQREVHIYSMQSEQSITSAAR